MSENTTRIQMIIRIFFYWFRKMVPKKLQVKNNEEKSKKLNIDTTCFQAYLNKFKFSIQFCVFWYPYRLSRLYVLPALKSNLPHD
jgi:hypothetical protein